jgi:preprotein translocase subunit SecB
MADNNDSGKAQGAGQATSAPQSDLQVRILGQYIKDLSFENPNVHKLIGNPGEKPSLRVDVSVNVANVADKVFESTIQFKAEATNNTGVIYDLELAYAGLFQIESIPEQMLEPFLLVNCPALIFPYLRRLVADLTREGGFPALALDPIDFASLYLKRQHEREQAAKPN